MKAQEKNNYKRSSLHLTLLSARPIFNDYIEKSVSDLVFPDKYNNHNLGFKSEDIEVIRNSIVSKTNKVSLSNLFDNYIEEQDIAKQLIAKWFNRKRNGSFDMNLVAERGYYNATELEASIAKKTIRGRALLADSGEGLIQNTFVVLSILDFKQEKKKFVINTYARLYKLKWDIDISEKFYNEYWVGSNDLNILKKKNFENNNIYSLEYVGEQNLITNITTPKHGPIIDVKTLENNYLKTTVKRVPGIAIRRKELFFESITTHFDNVYANLQKEYPVFRVRTPLVSVKPLAAQIGLKEGLKGGDKFEVLEQNFNEDTGRTTYKKVGVIIVDKDNIWDNRYNAGEEGTEDKKGATQFLGKGNFYEGMLIRQID